MPITIGRVYTAIAPRLRIRVNSADPSGVCTWGITMAD